MILLFYTRSMWRRSVDWYAFSSFFNGKTCRFVDVSMFAHLDSLWTLLEAMIARALQLFQAILDVREAWWPCGKLTLTVWSCLTDHVTGPYIQYMTAWCLTLVLFFVGFSWCINTKRHAHLIVGVKKTRWLSDMCCAMNNDHVHCSFPIRFLRHW